MKDRRLSLAALALICAMVCTAALEARPCVPARAQAPNLSGAALFLPFVAGTPTPAGIYDCNEYEFGLIWTSEVVTLNPDGTSTYAYAPPYTQVVSGTWVYTPTLQEIGFTNFRWITATVTLPNRLSIWHYLPQVDFEIGVSCFKRTVATHDADRHQDHIRAMIDATPRSRYSST